MLSQVAQFYFSSVEIREAKPSNVRGRISQFWRQTAAAALRHQKQAEEAAASTSASATNPEEVITQRALTTIFKHSWPTLQQVTCWQQSFQSLLQDPLYILINRYPKTESPAIWPSPGDGFLPERFTK
ncbi:hypothetical protein TSMEX_008204, partial [Taenia solium]|eukprot:TsM_001120600 transcript=TsM_001120600 gene=TsM_001120600